MRRDEPFSCFPSANMGVVADQKLQWSCLTCPSSLSMWRDTWLILCFTLGQVCCSVSWWEAVLYTEQAHPSVCCQLLDDFLLWQPEFSCLAVSITLYVPQELQVHGGRLKREPGAVLRTSRHRSRVPATLVVQCSAENLGVLTVSESLAFLM